MNQDVNSPQCWIGYTGVPGAKIGRGVTYLEIEQTFIDIPKPSTVEGWRGKVPAEVGLGVIACQTITHAPSSKGYPRMRRTIDPEKLAQAGSFRDTEFVRSEVVKMGKVCESTQASAVVFQSPPDLTPSSRNRERIAHFFADIATDEVFARSRRIWQPTGLWDLREAASLASPLGVGVAVDPVARDPLVDFHYSEVTGQEPYLRVLALGQKRLDRARLEALADIAHAHDQVWIVFAYPDGRREAQSLAKLVWPDPQP